MPRSVIDADDWDKGIGNPPSMITYPTVVNAATPNPPMRSMRIRLKSQMMMPAEVSLMHSEDPFHAALTISLHFPREPGRMYDEREEKKWEA